MGGVSTGRGLLVGEMMSAASFPSSPALSRAHDCAMTVAQAAPGADDRACTEQVCLQRRGLLMLTSSGPLASPTAGRDGSVLFELRRSFLCLLQGFSAPGVWPSVSPSEEGVAVCDLAE